MDGRARVRISLTQVLLADGPKGPCECGAQVRTHVLAEKYKCRYTVNVSAGAPFASSFEASEAAAQAGSGWNMTDGDCKYGYFVNGGKICGSGGFGTQFGVTKTGDWIVGGISNQSVQEQLGLSYSTGTYGWLVRNGSVITPPDPPDKPKSTAPRTALGVDRAGRLLMLVVDGCEQNAGCKYKELGQTFYETAALMSKLGAYQAVMVDGGGSSTAVANRTVVNRPTDTDLWRFKVERRVTGRGVRALND